MQTAAIRGRNSNKGLGRVRPDQCRNHQAIRYREVCRAAQAVDRRANNRLAQPLSSAGQGLGMSQPERPRIPTLSIHPLDGAKALSRNEMIPYGLLESTVILI
jgi:hypothetical protein